MLQCSIKCPSRRRLCWNIFIFLQPKREEKIYTAYYNQFGHALQHTPRRKNFHLSSLSRSRINACLQHLHKKYSPFFYYSSAERARPCGIYVYVHVVEYIEEGCSQMPCIFLCLWWCVVPWIYTWIVAVIIWNQVCECLTLCIYLFAF